MRKIIPYIASRYQRDRIWLRRTKPRARTHQVCIALDDSESMIDNESKKVAFESVALLSTALKLIEIKVLLLVQLKKCLTSISFRTLALSDLARQRRWCRDLARK